MSTLSTPNGPTVETPKPDQIKQVLKVTIKNVYGKETIYPACPTSKLLAKLAGQKTLNASMDTLRQLGYGMEIIAPSLVWNN